MKSLSFCFRRFALGLIVLTAAVLGASERGIGPAPVEAAVVSSIVVSGNTRVESETVKSYILIVPGRQFSNFDIDESLKALYGTGLFSDVSISQSGSRLNVVVVENPIVSTVIIQGNRKVKNDALLPLLQVKPRGVLTEAKLQGDINTMTDYYGTQGRSSVEINYSVTELPGNRVDVVYNINEGDRTAIGRISFVGNNAFSESRLRGVINSKKRSLFTLLNRKDVFSELRLAADQEALRQFYMTHGYADFRVLSVDWDFDEATQRYSVVFTVDEGPRYRFASISVDSTIPGVDGSSLMRYVDTRQGRIFNSVLIERSVENLTIELSRRGYSFVQVSPRGDRDYENNTVSITYLVDEGPRVYVERIDIYGNYKTRDYVIRREFDFSEGDPYNRVMVNRAERKLRNLNYFKTVQIVSEPGTSPDKVVLIVRVEEESTGEFSVGAGYSSSGFVAEITLDERNFLGRGQHLRASIGLGEDEQSYNISFTDPYFLGYNVSAGVDGYKVVQQKSSYRPYKNDILGGGVRMGLPITEDFKLELNYTLQRSRISESSKKTRVYYPNGEYITSAAGYDFVYNTLDNNFDPRQGSFIKVGQQFAGLGGDVNYMKSVGEGRFYTRLMPDADVVGMIRLGAGNITGLNGDQVRTSDNFFQGGETIRGFSPYGYGAVDKKTDTNLGGKNYWVASAEVQFPFPFISPDFGFRGAVFADAGTLMDVDVPPGGGPVINPNTIRSSVGGSIMWSSPVGLLRGDFSYVISKAKTDEEQWFRFSAGRRF